MRHCGNLKEAEERRKKKKKEGNRWRKRRGLENEGGDGRKKRMR